MAKSIFQVHAFFYVAVIALLLVINIMTTPLILWVLWPAVTWGFGLFIHGSAMVALGFMRWPEDFNFFDRFNTQGEVTTAHSVKDRGQAIVIDQIDPKSNRTALVKGSKK